MSKDLDLTGDTSDKVNLHDGAIALVHSFGCSGTHISGSLFDTLARQNKYWVLQP